MNKLDKFQDTMRRAIFFCFFFFALGFGRPAFSAFEGVSVSDQGTWDDVENVEPRYSSVSKEGRYIVFSSFSEKLVADDKNGFEDVFLRDRGTGKTIKISQSITLAKTDGRSTLGTQRSISAAGNIVVFQSKATNLTGYPKSFQNIYIRDIENNSTDLVSKAQGSPANEADGNSTGASISADGTSVVFQSAATNLVSGDGNGVPDIFLKVGKTLSRVNVSSSSAQSNATFEYPQEPSVSGDGSRIAFASLATNLVLQDTNNTSDVFVRDVVLQKTFRISVASDGSELNGDSSNPSISDDGCRIAFVSQATNAIAGKVLRKGHVYVRDICEETTSLVSQNTSGNEAIYVTSYSNHPVISGDGNRIAFQANATNLRNFGTPFTFAMGIYLRDLKNKTTQLVTVSKEGLVPDSFQILPSINYDGSFVTFYGRAPKLVPEAPEQIGQVFIYYNLLPQASFSARHISDLLTLKFERNEFYDPDGVILGYLWDFGEGQFSTEESPTQTYKASGIYKVKLSVIDNAYAIRTFEKDIQIEAHEALGGGGFSCAVQTQPFQNDAAPILLLGVLLWLGRFFVAKKMFVHH